MNKILRTLVAMAALSLAGAAAAQPAAIYTRSVGGGGGADLSSAVCTPPLACAAGSWTWVGATLSGTPAAGDLSYWTGSGTEGLVLNSSGSSGKVLTWASGVAPTWSSPAGGSLSSLAAASAVNTIANGDNLQTWQWAKTADTSGGLRVTESAASTGGTSSAGVPNQYLLKLDTVAASTASPLTVYQRGAHVFSVDPTNPQIVANSGALSNPSYSFAAGTNTGLYYSSNVLNFAVAGTRYAFDSGVWYGPTGTGTAPGITDLGNQNSGLFIGNVLSGISINNTENTKWTAGVAQHSKGTADAASYAINVRKARGTVASPTVITTGDDLFTITGYGYVGGTNTYQDAAAVRLDSVGTISDATNGIGGEAVVSTKKQGANTTVIDRWKIDQFGHVTSLAGTGNTPTMGACGTSPSVAGTDNAMAVTVGTGGSATSCVINFGTAYTTNAPICNANTSATGDAAIAVTTSTSAVTVTKATALTASSTLLIQCIGRL